jgi:hypothetical protein
LGANGFCGILDVHFGSDVPEKSAPRDQLLSWLAIVRRNRFAAKGRVEKRCAGTLYSTECPQKRPFSTTR